MAVSIPFTYHQNTYGYPTLFFTTSELTCHYNSRRKCDIAFRSLIWASFAPLSSQLTDITRQRRSRNACFLLSRIISVRHHETAILHRILARNAEGRYPSKASFGIFLRHVLSRRYFENPTPRKRATATASPASLSNIEKWDVLSDVARTLLRAGFRILLPSSGR